VSEPTFAQPERPSFAAPIVVALIVLVFAGLALRHLLPSGTVEATIVSTAVLPEVTVFQSDSRVLTPRETAHVFFVASTVRIDNKGQRPVSLEDFKLAFTNAKGEQVTPSAVYRSDLANLELMYPALKPLTANLLVRDTVVAPGQSAIGTLLFALDIPESMWNGRQSAILEIDPYHLDPIHLTVHK
jgi:hypothetical protein